jgi:hypothetical protein
MKSSDLLEELEKYRDVQKDVANGSNLKIALLEYDLGSANYFIKRSVKPIHRFYVDGM